MTILKKLNWFIFKNNELLFLIFKIFSFCLSIIVLSTLVFRYGMLHTEPVKETLDNLLKAYYLLYFISFLYRLLIHSDRIGFIKVNILETILLVFVLYNSISFYLFEKPLLLNFMTGLNNELSSLFAIFIIHFFLFLMAFIDLFKLINNVFNSNVKPTTLFIFSFLFLIFSGSLLLHLPGFNNKGVFLNWVDAIFTSASATCVTGLSVQNTSTFFNYKGQFVILALIQMGGIGILTFASFFASFIKKGVGVKQQIAMNKLFDSESFDSSFFLIKRILYITVFIEFVGAIGIYVLWGDYQFDNQLQKIWYSVFHSVSAFCNAGFSLFENGFESEVINQLYILHIFMGCLVIFGGLGFPVLRDIFSPLKLRERMKEPWRQWTLSTKIAVYTSLALIIFGMLMFYVLHIQYLNIKNPIGVFATTFFQSVNCRTSGFNTISLNNLSNTTMMVSVFLMFIGASSMSTGGGIKTTTFVVIFLAVIGTIRGKEHITLSNRTIGKDLIYKAFAVVIFSGIFLLFSITLMSYFEPKIPMMKIVYETISSFATVGLTTGITTELGNNSKLYLALCMFLGRVGVLTLAFSLSFKVVTQGFKYPDTHIMIG